MSDAKQPEDRSMSEILSSIRRIVSDEEKTRREADDDRRKHESENGASVLVLTEEMRDSAPRPPVDFAEADAPEPAAELSPAPTLGAAPLQADFSAPGLSESEIEEIVRRIVREELQGPIGQQISRKVKRLIREEIAKALADGDGEDDALI